MKNYFCFTHGSSFPLHEGQLFYWSIMTAVDSIKCWCANSRHVRPSGRLSNSRGLSASVSFLSSPPLPPLYLHQFLRSLLLSFSFFAPKPHRNACYAGYTFLWCSLLHACCTRWFVLTFDSVDEILKCHHINESYRAVLSCVAVYHACCTRWFVLTFWVCEWNSKVWPFSWKLRSSTFLWYCLLYYTRWF